jgi:hypothetical protein
MAGRHSKREAHGQVAEQRRPHPVRITDAVGITDARTRIEHLMTDAAAMEHRHVGRYLALCGIEVLAASLTDPGRGQCQPCATQAASWSQVEPSTASSGRATPSLSLRQG